MGEKRVMKSANFGQGCCAVDEYLTRNIDAAIFMKTKAGSYEILQREKLSMMIHHQMLMKST